MNDTPAADDAADDLEALYRKCSALELSRPSAQTRQAILEHSQRIAANRSQPPRDGWSTPSASSRAGSSHSKWQRPVLVGTLAAAALAGLLIGPQFLRPPAPPETQAMSRLPRVSGLKPLATSQPSGSSASATSESAPQVMDLPPPVPAPRVRLPAAPAPPGADAAEGPTTGPAVAGASDARVPGEVAAARTDGNENVSVTGMRRQRTAGAPTADAAAQASRATAGDHSSAPEQVPDAAGALDARDSDGRTALMLAVVQNRLDAVVDLLRRGADPNAADDSGVRPLQAARAQNEPDVADALVHAGAR